MSDQPTVFYEKRTIEGSGAELTLHIFRPAADVALPVLLYMAGGGFIGYPGSLDQLYGDIVLTADCIVVGVQYRLAPQHIFPAAHDDCLSALNYCKANAASFGGDPNCLAVGGDSVGGLLAAALTLLAQENKAPQVRFQFLAYPMLAGETVTPSREKFAEAGLSIMLDGWRAYAAQARSSQNPLLQPLNAKTYAGLPPALVVTAELDPLRDEGELYASHLERAGVPVVKCRYAGGMHAFLTQREQHTFRNDAIAQLGKELRRAVAPPALVNSTIGHEL